jgi:hypothetical protein
MSCSSTQNIRFQLRRATEAQWISTNPVLLPGEPAVSTDTKQIKIGNGSNWVNTDYINLAGGVGASGTPTTLQSLITVSNAVNKNITVINLSSSITLQVNQAVIFPSNINATPPGSAGNISANTTYYIFSCDPVARTIQVKVSVSSGTPY